MNFNTINGNTIKVSELEDLSYTILSTRKTDSKGFYRLKLLFRSMNTEFIIGAKSEESGVKFLNDNIDTFRKIAKEQQEPKTIIKVETSNVAYCFTTFGFHELVFGIKLLVFGILFLLLTIPITNTNIGFFGYILARGSFLGAFWVGSLGLIYEIYQTKWSKAKHTFLVALESENKMRVENIKDVIKKMKESEKGTDNNES